MSPDMFHKFMNYVHLSVKFTLYKLILALSFISGGDSPEGPAKEYDGSWIDSRNGHLLSLFRKKYAAPDCILMHHTSFSTSIPIVFRWPLTQEI